MLRVLEKMLLAQRRKRFFLFDGYLCRTRKIQKVQEVILELCWNPALGLSKIPQKTQKKNGKKFLRYS